MMTRHGFYWDGCMIDCTICTMTAVEAWFFLSIPWLCINISLSTLHFFLSVCNWAKGDSGGYRLKQTPYKRGACDAAATAASSATLELGKNWVVSSSSFHLFSFFLSNLTSSIGMGRDRMGLHAWERFAVYFRLGRGVADNVREWNPVLKNDTFCSWLSLAGCTLSSYFLTCLSLAIL